MKSICKFIEPSFSGDISTSRFVIETNTNIMKTPRVLTSPRMLLAVAGEGYIKFNNQQFNFRTGSLYFGFEKETFSVEPSSECAYIYIDFSGGRANNLFERFKIHKGNRHFEKFDGLIPLWKDSLSRAGIDTIDLASESILLYTFSRLSCEFSNQNNLVDKILKLTEENFTDPGTSISQIASELSYNSKYLSHIFKKSMKVTYSEYLRELRIKYAISLFDGGIDSVKSVALLSGFSDPLYFSNTFKKVVGISPSDYVASQKIKRMPE